MKKIYTSLFFFAILFVLYIFYILIKPEKQIQKTKEKEIILTNNNQFNQINCDPINKNYTQFRVEIDGEIYPKSVVLFRNKTINFECLDQSNKIKKILMWNMEQSYSSFNVGVIKPFIDNKCPVTKCALLDDKSFLNESDLVITRMSDDVNMPSYRPPNQKWVFMLFESPFHLREIFMSSGFSSMRRLWWDLNSFNNQYNLTSSYRVDSDFPGHYETFSGMYWEKNESFDPDYDFHKDKTHFAAAVVSNCNSASSKRLNFIKELNIFVPVDLFGKCGKKCPNDKKNKIPCKSLIGKKYKFYLSFENSFCDQYITEKFFEILEFNIIPIVRGQGNYEYYVPTSGYINANDYESPRELAKYLKYLDSNPIAYNSYFKWKKYVKFDKYRSAMSPLCDMCIYMHLEEFFGIEKKIVKDLTNFTSIEENCVKPDPFNVFPLPFIVNLN